MDFYVGHEFRSRLFPENTIVVESVTHIDGEKARYNFMITAYPSHPERYGWHGFINSETLDKRYERIES